MRHPTEGVLRRLLDEPAGVADADRAHVAGCGECLTLLATSRDDADLVGAALSRDAGTDDLDVDAAWRRLTTAATTAAPHAGPATERAPARRRAAVRARAALRRPAVAGVAVAVFMSGAAAAAASDWLPIFRTQQVAPVSFSTADLVSLPDLSAYGDLAVTSEPDVQQVPDAATAKQRSGLDVPQPDGLPRGVTGEPTYQVLGKVSATFTFSAERAASAAAGAGQALPTPPPGLDGARVRLEAGPGVAAVWSQSAGVPALLVGRAVAPTAFSSGVELEVVRDYLLSLPGLPDDVADQLRSFTGDGSTLPLPVPSDELVSTTREVDGVPATVLGTRDGALTAVVWVQDGLVGVVAGSMDGDEAVAVAEGLR
ncbi:MAG TPA: hypothetical protein VF661_09770 [Actinomycetales bacterium]|jgi:hypothetical protein